MAKPLEFWFEFASTYSYPAALQIETACAEAGVALVWRSFLLGPVFAAQGLTGSPFQVYPEKGAYMWRDMERLCQAQALDFVKPSSFPRGSLLAARIASAHAKAPWIGDFVRAVYTANFAEDRDIGSDEVIHEILASLSSTAESVVAAATTPEAKTALRLSTEEAQSKGVFGAPSYTVGDELFWGQDRLTAAVAWAASA